MNIKRGIVAAVIASLSVGAAAPAHASTDSGPCQIMGPYYVEGAVDCACLVAAVVVQAVRPGSPPPCLY